MEAHVFNNFFLRWNFTFQVTRAIKLPISMRDWHFLVARFSKNQVYLFDIICLYYFYISNFFQSLLQRFLFSTFTCYYSITLYTILFFFFFKLKRLSLTSSLYVRPWRRKAVPNSKKYWKNIKRILHGGAKIWILFSRGKTIFYSLAALVRKILFLPRENKIHFFKPPCNVLFII